jgi:hypothetical protein
MSYVQSQRQGTGWLAFAAVIMIMAGITRLFDAFWAFDKDDEVTGRLQAVMFDNDLAVYGWIWLVVGLLLIVAGIAVLGGSEWARWFGILMAMIAAISSILWIYDFPIWSLVSTFIAVLVIYALTVYGGRESLDSAP